MNFSYHDHLLIFDHIYISNVLHYFNCALEKYRHERISKKINKFITIRHILEGSLCELLIDVDAPFLYNGKRCFIEDIYFTRKCSHNNYKYLRWPNNLTDLLYEIYTFLLDLKFYTQHYNCKKLNTHINYLVDVISDFI